MRFYSDAECASEGCLAHLRDAGAQTATRSHDSSVKPNGTGWFNNFGKQVFDHICQQARPRDALAGEILIFRTFDPTFSRAARLQQRLQP
jgi:hypothetical protein